MLRHWLEDNAITFHHHQWGITPSTFHSIKDWQHLNDNEKESCKIELLVIPLQYIAYILTLLLCCPRYPSYMVHRIFNLVRQPWEELHENFEIVATSKDRQNQSFISLMQSRTLARDCPWERGTFPNPFFSTEFTVAVFLKIFYVVYIHSILFSQRCCCVSFCLLCSCQFSI